MNDEPPLVDVRGLACSDAVVRLHRRLMPMAPHSAVRVRADDEEVMRDLKRYAQRAGHGWGKPVQAAGGATEVEVRRSA
jgi:TusA-related sulfurtransferase